MNENVFIHLLSLCFYFISFYFLLSFLTYVLLSFIYLKKKKNRQICFGQCGVTLGLEI